jgi:hypothetical protein
MTPVQLGTRVIPFKGCVAQETQTPKFNDNSNDFGSNIPNFIQIYPSLCLGTNSVSRNMRSIEHNLPPARLLIWMHERNTTILHVHVFHGLNSYC